MTHAYVALLTQKLFRDNHAAYEKVIRDQVQQQLGL